MQTEPIVLARGLTGSQTYSTFQYDLVLYALVAVGMGLFASMIYALVTRTEVSKKYRGAVGQVEVAFVRHAVGDLDRSEVGLRHPQQLGLIIFAGRRLGTPGRSHPVGSSIALRR